MHFLETHLNDIKLCARKKNEKSIKKATLNYDFIIFKIHLKFNLKKKQHTQIIIYTQNVQNINRAINILFKKINFEIE